MLAAGTTGSVQSASASFKSVKIGDVPHVRQQPDFCGEACAEMYLKKLGKHVDQNDVFNHSGLAQHWVAVVTPGNWRPRLRRIGFRTGNVWSTVTEENSVKGMAG